MDFDTKILVKIFEFNIMNDSYSGLGYHQQKTKLKKSRFTSFYGPKGQK